MVYASLMPVEVVNASLNGCELKSNGFECKPDGCDNGVLQAKVEFELRQDVQGC